MIPRTPALRAGGLFAVANAFGVQRLPTRPFGDDPASAAAASARPPAGLVLGRYRLLERLGAGGFGVVWRALDERLGREVAVKRIILGPGAVPDRVTREALATARLAHPAVVALYEAAPDGDAFCLVSELVQGETLAQLIAADALTDEDVLAIGLCLCAALEHAHERGVIHRDVKPQNVLIPEPGGVQQVAAKLADFGGAWVTGEDPLTRTGDVMGTLAYMSPEQAEGGAVGLECDLYSCALVCFEALTGVNPVRGGTPAATARRIGTRLPSLRDYRSDLDGCLVAAIDAALDPVPEDRGELRDLSEALAAASPAPSRRRGWWRGRRRPLDDADGQDEATGPLEPATDVISAVTRADLTQRLGSAAREVRTVQWPEVAWETEDPTRAHAPRPRRTHPALALRRPRLPEPQPADHDDRIDPSGAPSDPAASTATPQHASITQLRPAPRLLAGAGCGALVGAALYGLGGATQQAAWAGAVLAAVAMLLLPRLGWIAATVGVSAWLVAANEAGLALCAVAAAAPVAVLLRRPGPAWPAPALAPLLGLVGLAGAYPALAGQLSWWPRRAVVGVLGYWWLVLAEPVLGRRLWLGPPSGSTRAQWHHSITAAAAHMIGPLLSPGLLLGAAAWGCAAIVLPWVVRGRHAAVDVVAATVWSALLAASAPVLDHGNLAASAHQAPRGIILAAVLGGLIAVTTRAARGTS